VTGPGYAQLGLFAEVWDLRETVVDSVYGIQEPGGPQGLSRVPPCGGAGAQPPVATGQPRPFGGEAPRAARGGPGWGQGQGATLAGSESRPHQRNPAALARAFRLCALGTTEEARAQGRAQAARANRCRVRRDARRAVGRVRDLWKRVAAHEEREASLRRSLPYQRPNSRVAVLSVQLVAGVRRRLRGHSPQGACVPGEA